MVFLGGAVLANIMADKESMWVTKAEWEEQGTRVWREELGEWRRHGRSGTGGSVPQTYPEYLDGPSILDVVCGRVFAPAGAACEAVQQSSG